MLIISKWHDYYDTICSYGVDKTCVYNREQEEIKLERTYWNQPYYITTPNKTRIEIPRVGSRETGPEVRIHRFILGFCGEFYPFVHIDAYGKKPLFFYDVEEYSEYREQHKLFENERRYSYGSWNKYDARSKRGVNAFFNDLDGLHTKSGEIFHTFRVPAFVIKDSVVELNPCLKDIGFMKVKDPQAAYQNIYMYLSGVIGAPPQPKEKMSDEVMAAAKGHDSFYSFKKPPGKKVKWR